MPQIISFLQKCFDSLQSSIVLPLNKIGYHLVKTAKSISYVETLGEHADSLHGWIKRCYEQDFQHAFQRAVLGSLRHLSLSFAHLAIDFTDEPFYGRTRSLYIFNAEPCEKYDGKFRFITVSVITRNKQIPLMALPVLVGEGIAPKTMQLLEYAQTLFKRIRFVVFDREFYVAELIDYLESKKLRYLILVPEKTGRIKGYVEQTDELGKFKHIMEYQKEKSKWRPKTTIVVCKGIDEYAWIFATNMNFRTRVEYIWYYKRRWQIETNYRVEDEGKIKSKSTHHLIRYFYFLVSQLMRLFWVVNKKVKYYVPFKKYLDIIENHLLYDYLEIQHT